MRLPDWHLQVGRDRPRQVTALIAVDEGAQIRLSGLEPGEAISIGGIGMAADGHGVFEFAPSNHDDFRCHVGLLGIIGQNGSGFELDIRPGKLSVERYELLRQDLQETWAGIVLDPSGATTTSAMANPADRLWDDRTRSALESLLAVPPTQLRPLPTVVPIDRARQLTTPTATFVEAMRSGRPVGALAPAPVVCTRELGFVRDSLERLRALALRQRAVAPTGSPVAHRLERTAASIGRYLEHPMLRVPRFDGRPTHLLRADRRLRRILELRSALSNSDAPIVEGPGELRLGLRGLDRLYEMWVFLATLREATARYGAPLTGIDGLARRLHGDRLRLYLADGTEVVFPGGIRVAFNPPVRNDPSISWRGLELPGNPMRESSARLATPDVMVLGPGRDAVVIDAKYRARHLVDAAAVEIHDKYSRIRRHGDGVVQHVVAAHPHETYAFRYAGYSMLPCAPGLAFPEIPWPAPAALHRVTEPQMLTEPPQQSPVDGSRPPVAAEETAAVSGESRTPGPSVLAVPEAPTPRRGSRVTDEPELVLVDQTWTREAIGNRRLDLKVLAQFTGVGPRSPGYFVGYTGPGIEAFLQAARSRGWKTEDAPHPAALLETAERLVRAHGSNTVVVVSGNDQLIDLLESLCDAVEVVDDLSMVIRR